MTNIIDTADLLALSSSEVRTFIDATAREMRGMVKRHAEQTAEKVVRAAYATFLAYRDGILSDSPKAQWGPDTISTADYVAPFGVSRTNVTVWRHLGHAVLSVGIVPDFKAEWDGSENGADTYRRLSAGNVVQVPEVKAAIMADGATPESVRAVVLEWSDPETGRKLSQRQHDDRLGITPVQSDEEREAEVKAAAEVLESEQVAPIVAAETAIGVLRAVLPNLEPEDFDTVARTLAKLVRDEKAARTAPEPEVAETA